MSFLEGCVEVAVRSRVCRHHHLADAEQALPNTGASLHKTDFPELEAKPPHHLIYASPMHGIKEAAIEMVAYQ